MDSDNDICMLCGTTSVCGESPILCGDCRDKCLRLRIPPWVIAFLALVCLAAAVLSLQLPSVTDTYRTYLQAERDRNEKRFSPALEGYIAVLDKYDNSVPIILSAVESAMGAQYFDGAAYILNTYAVGKTLNDDQYGYAMSVSDFLDREYDTHDACIEILTGADDPDLAKDALLGMLEEPGLDKTYIYFLLASISPDIQEQLYYLQLSSQQDRRCTYPLAYYGNALRRAGEYQAAMDVYADALERNACDTYALRGVGIVEQMRGDKLQGLETVQAAYGIDPYELYISEALIIALCESGRRDEAMALMQERLAEDYEYGQDMYDYLDGRMTMAEYYTQ